MLFLLQHYPMDLMQQFLCILMGIVVFCFVGIRYRLGYWKHRGVLHEKPRFFWGHLYGFGEKYHIKDVISKMYRKFHGQATFIGIYFWIKPMILLLDLDAMQVIIDKNGWQYFPSRYYYFLFNSHNIYSNGFQDSNKLQQNICLIENKLSHLSMNFHQSFNIIPSGDRNISKLVEELNSHILRSLFYNQNYLDWDSNEFHIRAKDLQNNSSNKANITFLLWPPLKSFLESYCYDKKTYNYFRNLIQARLSDPELYLDSNQIYDFYNSDQIEEETLNISNFITNTISYTGNILQACKTTISCCLWELAKQPYIQDKARHEIRHILRNMSNNNNKLFSLKDQFKYLQHILYETLRKYPPYPFLSIVANEDYDLPNSVMMLQHGNHVIIPVEAIHHNPKFYTNPEQFNPDHFLDSEIANRPSNAYLPFLGCGLPTISGQRMVIEYILIFLITLLNRYEFRLSKTTSIQFEYETLLLKPKHDIWLEIKVI